MNIVKFVFSPFQENTYVLYDKTKECVIIDPGCYDENERNRLVELIESRGLTPVRLLNTHCHIDHIFGNKFVSEKYNLPLESHKDEQEMIAYSESKASLYGVELELSPAISVFWDEGDIITFGESELAVLFTPGHSPASISFYARKHNFIIGGDVLFRQSIGRTDLQGGNFETLLNSIRTKFFTLPNDTKVYSGHGEVTTVEFEKLNNPFLQ
jgi:glyoxylase-like metal-dependent hydrolase (beta-lactamase superfamily II)